MKNTNLFIGKYRRIIILSILLIASSAISFNQIRSLKEIRCHHTSAKSFYIIESNSYHNNEYSVSKANASTDIPHDEFASNNRFRRSFDGNIELEEWMKSPFEIDAKSLVTSSYEITIEDNPEIEEWMSTPFIEAIEPGIIIEPWMRKPFETINEPNIPIENWMLKPFIQEFEPGIDIEIWMTVPFEINL